MVKKGKLNINIIFTLYIKFITNINACCSPNLTRSLKFRTILSAIILTCAVGSFESISRNVNISSVNT
jgi:hypothetical protein